MVKPNPFTPKSGLEPKVFINRDKEISFFIKRIGESKHQSINHYIINGIWGSGKTSLLRKIKYFDILMDISFKYMLLAGLFMTIKRVVR